MHAHKTHLKTELIAGLSMFFTTWTITCLYAQLMPSAHLDAKHWFTAISILFISGAILSALLIKKVYLIGPGLNIAWLFNTLLAQNQPTTPVFYALMLSGPILVLLSQMKFIQQCKTLLPQALQENINIGIGCLFMRIALEQEYSQSTLSIVLFTITILCLLICKWKKITSGFIITTLILITLAYLTHQTAWHGWLMRPQIHHYLWTLPHVSLYRLETIKSLFEITLFSIFDTAIGVFCLQQLQRILHNPQPAHLGPTYQAVGLNNLCSSILLCGPNTMYIESTVGIQIGAQTSLSVLILGSCFILFLFCYPITSMIPLELFRGILFFIGCNLASNIYQLQYRPIPQRVLSIALILFMLIQRSVMNGLIISIVTYYLWQKYHQQSSSSMLRFAFILSIIILILRCF